MGHQHHPETDRWGGPGASKENADKPMPKKKDTRSPGEPTNTRFSHVSGGGGERDLHHGHADKDKRDTEENSFQRRKP
jgi:hypothetical protein